MSALQINTIGILVSTHTGFKLFIIGRFCHTGVQEESSFNLDTFKKGLEVLRNPALFFKLLAENVTNRLSLVFCRTSPRMNISPLKWDYKTFVKTESLKVMNVNEVSITIIKFYPLWQLPTVLLVNVLINRSDVAHIRLESVKHTSPIQICLESSSTEDLPSWWKTLIINYYIYFKTLWFSKKIMIILLNLPSVLLRIDNLLENWKSTQDY